MSSHVVVRPEEFEKAVKKAIADYGDEATEKLEQITKDVTRQAVKELKGTAPSGGQYGRGWTHKAKKSGAYKLSETVYNRLYMLTHLLEKPHATGGGGHYPKNVDYTGSIARVEEEYTEKYMEEVTSRL